MKIYFAESTGQYGNLEREKMIMRYINNRLFSYFQIIETDKSMEKFEIYLDKK